jgi:hypothetical protein
MKKLMQLIESTVPTTISYKGNLPDKVLKVDPSDQETVNNIKTDPNIDHASMGQKKIKEEIGRKYTAEESAAVGKTVGKSLLKVLRGQGDEVVDIRLTGIGLNKFGIKVKYGNDKGKDTFRFTLNPDTEDITLDLGRGNHEQLVDFVITQGNTVSLPTPELEDKLSDAMKKYTSEPSDDEYDQMAAMEPESDPSQIGKYIPEEVANGNNLSDKFSNEEILRAIAPLGKFQKVKQYLFSLKKSGEKFNTLEEYIKHFKNFELEAESLSEKKLTKPEVKKREEIVKAMKKQGEPKDARTYAIATAQAKKLAEDLDLGHEDDEPGMLLSDIYGIMQSAKSLYELVSQFKGQQEVDFPHWWQAKIVNAKANLSAARQYLDYEVNKPQQVNIAAVALEEGKSTCCHKCGHVHVKGTAHPTPYLTGQKNCKFRD